MAMAAAACCDRAGLLVSHTSCSSSCGSGTSEIHSRQASLLLRRRTGFPGFWYGAPHSKRLLSKHNVVRGPSAFLTNGGSHGDISEEGSCDGEFDPLGLRDETDRKVENRVRTGPVAIALMVALGVQAALSGDGSAMENLNSHLPDPVATLAANFSGIAPLEGVLANSSFALLFVTTLLYWGKPLYMKNKWLGNSGQKGMMVAFACNTGFLVSRWIESGHLPLSNLYESSIFLSWCLCLIHLVVEFQYQNEWIGVITAPSAMLTHAFATLGIPKEMQRSSALVPALQSNWLMMHVSMMIVSYATLILGSVLAITYLAVNFAQNGNVALSTGGESDSRKLRLPQQLDNWSYRIIGLGFPCLTVGILSGAVWANEAWGSYWSWDPKETWALITWLIFAIYLHTRMNKGWQGEKPAIVASLGFFIIWICYLGVNLLGKGLHSYGWI